MLTEYTALCACMTSNLADSVRTGWIHSSFDSAVNLFFPGLENERGRLVTLLSSKKPLVPDGIKLSETAFTMAQAAPIQSPVHIGDLRLWGNALPHSIDFGQNLQENPRIPLCNPKALHSAIVQVRNAKQKPNGLSNLSAANYNSRMTMLHLLAESLNQGDTVNALDCLASCAGAGPGLTPSTDDMAVGIITALRACGCTAPFPDPDSAYAALEGITTEVGRHYICCALEGYITETMQDALAGNSHTWEQLVDTGAYSGMDTLTGLEIGCQLFI